jgi:hypothetical protein
MSTTNKWMSRLDNYRYSQDERMLTYKFQKELEPVFTSFTNDNATKSLVVGNYNLENEPWRSVAIKYLARQFGLKVTDKPNSTEDANIEFTVTKQKLSTRQFG